MKKELTKRQKTTAIFFDEQGDLIAYAWHLTSNARELV